MTSPEPTATKTSTGDGLSIGDYGLDELLGEGTFSWVYAGRHHNGRETRAFKVAKPREWIGAPSRPFLLHPRRPTPFVTFCLEFGSDGYFSAPVDPGVLLRLQYEKLSACADPALVRVEDLVADGPFPHYRMERLSGPSLRQAIEARDVPFAALVDLARAMDRLSRVPAFGYHGDLKPENVILTAEGVKLIDPGFVGDLAGPGGTHRRVMITTPAYNPFRARRDLLSFGIVLWEVVCGRHPLLPILRQLLEGSLLDGACHEGPGSDFFAHLPERIVPISQARRDLPPRVEQAVYRGMGLRLAADPGPDPERPRLEKDPGFEGFAEAAAALEEVAGLGFRV